MLLRNFSDEFEADEVSLPMAVDHGRKLLFHQLEVNSNLLRVFICVPVFRRLTFMYSIQVL